MTQKKKKLLSRRSGLYLKDTKAKGRGVFCTSRIRKGEELEVTPALILNEKETVDADRTLLNNYTFVTGSISKSLRSKAGVTDPGQASAVIMGITSFCNHSSNPNAGVEWEEHGGSLYYTLRATRDIPANTEICTSYGAGWFDEREV